MDDVDAQGVTGPSEDEAARVDMDRARKDTGDVFSGALVEAPSPALLEVARATAAGAFELVSVTRARGLVKASHCPEEAPLAADASGGGRRSRAVR